MTTTTNFAFTIPDGSDNVNLLTQNYPNWTSLDAILKAIKDTGTTEATATKTGTNFAVVRSDSDCKVFRFVATANYASGDSFTVDGVPVTATSVAGTALESGAFVINQTVLAALNGAVLTIYVGGASTPDASDVTYDNSGSGLAAADVQAAIDEVEGNVETLETNVTKKIDTELTQTVLAGATQVTFTDAAITANAKLMLFFDDIFIPFTSVTAGVGTVTYQFEALAANATATLWIVD